MPHNSPGQAHAFLALVTFHQVTSKIYIAERRPFTPDQLESMVNNRFNNMLFSNLAENKPSLNDLLSERLVRKMRLETELGNGLLQKRMFPYRRLTKRGGGNNDHKMFAGKRSNYETSYRAPPGLESFRSFKKKRNSAFKRNYMLDAMREASIPATYHELAKRGVVPTENLASNKNPASMSQAEWFASNYIPNLGYMQDKRMQDPHMQEDTDLHEKRSDDHVHAPDNHKKKSGLASSLKSVNPNEFGFSDYDGGLASSYFADMKKRTKQRLSSHNAPIFRKQTWQKRHGNGLMRRDMDHQNGQAVRYSVPSVTHGKTDDKQVWYSAKREHKRSSGDADMFAKRSSDDEDMFAKRMCVTCSRSEDGFYGGRGGGFSTGYNEHGANDYHAYDEPEEYSAVNKAEKRNLGTVTFNDIKAGSDFY